jgi:cell division protein FtsB
MRKAIRMVLFNKYILTIIAFGIWMIFFDNNSLRRQRQLNRKIDEIRRMKEYYQQEISRNEEAIYELENNLETVEKYAREKYLMKRDSEDVYIIVRE